MTKIFGIVGTQRSGSNYVCSALRSIDRLGDPREYFNPIHIHEEGKVKQSKEDALTFSHELVAKTNPEKFFSFKLHYLQFHENFLAENILLTEAFPNIKIIFLRRSNIIKQAISLWKAELTQSWIADMEEKKQAHYNFGEIRNRYYDLKIHDLMWARYLYDHKIPFLNVIYEDMEKNEAKFFYNILAFLGEAGKCPQLKKPSLKKQSNQQSIDWEIRFKEEFRKAPPDQNKAAWIERTRRWDAEVLGDDPGVWREF